MQFRTSHGYRAWMVPLVRTESWMSGVTVGSKNREIGVTAMPESR